MYYRGAGAETLFKEEQARKAMSEESRFRMGKFVRELRRKSPKATPISPKEAISGTDIGGAYAFYQLLSSDAGHPSLTALDRHIVVEAAGTVIEGLSLKPRIKEGEVMDTAFLTSMALLGVCIAANTSLGQTQGGERLVALKAEYLELAASREGCGADDGGRASKA